MKNRSNLNQFSMDNLETRSMMSASPAVVGYLPDYGFQNVYNADSGKLDKIDWSSLTQINYFSLQPNGDTGALPTKSSSNGSLSQLTKVVTEAHANGVKVSVVIGGADLDDSLAQIANNHALHETFARNLQTFADAYDLDGIDLDLEKQHPTLQQIANYGDLIETVQERTTGLTISAAVYAEKLSIATDTDPNGDLWTNREWQLDADAVAALDQIGIMDYDLHYSDHSGLDRSKGNMDAWADFVGAENKSKLLFGVPFYGKAGYGWGKNTDGSKQHDGQSYNTLVDTYLNNHSSLSTSTDAINAAYTGKLGGQTYAWNFNGVDTIQQKTQYAIDQGFGGVMAWDLAQDHVAGTNATVGQTDQYSLLSAIGRTVRANANTPVLPTDPTPDPTPTPTPTPTGNGTGAISGCVFSDKDENGWWSGTDTGVAGRTIFIDVDNDWYMDTDELRTTTDANGWYQFTGLDTGTYNVRLNVAAGTYVTTAGSHLTEVLSGRAATEVDFGESLI